VEGLGASPVGIELIAASYPQEPGLAVDKIQCSEIPKDEMKAAPMKRPQLVSSVSNCSAFLRARFEKTF
jgi:hypothetical protein